MISIKCRAREDRKSSRGVPVILYININNHRLSYSTGIYINKGTYLINNRVSNKDELYKSKNKKLTKILSLANITALEENDINRVKEILDEAFGKKKKEPKVFIDYMAEYMSMKKHLRTAKLYQSTINKIEKYDKRVKTDDIDRKWLVGFEEYCKKDMSINGYSVYMRNIRTVFNWLLSEGKTDKYPFKAYKIKTEKTLHRALDIEKLRRLKEYNCEHHLEKYRDVFMLMVYLIGINPKDLLHLKEENIIDGRIVYHRYKTRVLYGIKIEPEAEEIIERYRGNKWLLRFLDTSNDYLTFVRNMSRGLKKMGFDISSYWARHTWASIAFEIGISKDVISLALGHSNGVKVTDIYIKYDWTKVDEANRKVIDYIQKNKRAQE